MLIMKVCINITDYKELLNYVLPKLPKINTDNNIGSILMKSLLLNNNKPSFLANQLASRLPHEFKNKIVIKLISDSQVMIIEEVNSFAVKNHVNAEIIDMNVNSVSIGGISMLKFEIIFNEIDYNEVIENLLPVILMNQAKKDGKPGELAKVLYGMEDIPIKMLTAALDVLPQDAKNELIIKILSIYKEDIKNLINLTAHEQHIKVEVANINMEDIHLD